MDWDPTHLMRSYTALKLNFTPFKRSRAILIATKVDHHHNERPSLFALFEKTLSSSK